MAEEQNNTPNNENAPTTAPAQPAPPSSLPEETAETAAEASAPAASTENSGGDYEERLERLGGEPAPVITPEEFARLQRAGQVQIDARGRVRTTRREDADGGVSLRKRRAWYC